MKKELQLKKDEALHEWVDRIADSLVMSANQREAMHEVIKESYIKGTNDTLETMETAQINYTLEYANNGVIIRDQSCPLTEVVPFGEKESTTPCALALGELLYEDIDEINKNFGFCRGFKLAINLQTLEGNDDD